MTQVWTVTDTVPITNSQSKIASATNTVYTSL